MKKSDNQSSLEAVIYTVVEFAAEHWAASRTFHKQGS